MPIFDELVVVSKDTPNFAYPGSDGLVVVDGQSVLSNDSDNPLKISAYDHKITCKGCSGGGGTLDGAVRYDIVQTLTDAEKKRARDNIGITDDPTPPTPVPGDCLWEETTETFIPYYINVSQQIDAPTVDEFNKFVDRFYELESDGSTRFGAYKDALKAQYADYLAAVSAETADQFAKRIFVSVTEDGASVDSGKGKGYSVYGYDFSGDHCHVVSTGTSILNADNETCDVLAVDLPYMSKSYAANISEGIYNGEGDYAKRMSIVDVNTFNSEYDARKAEGESDKQAVLAAITKGGFDYNRTIEELEPIESYPDYKHPVTKEVAAMYDNLVLCAKPAKLNGADIETVVSVYGKYTGVLENRYVIRPHTLSVDLYSATNRYVSSGTEQYIGNNYFIKRQLMVALPRESDISDSTIGYNSRATSNFSQFGIVETFSVSHLYSVSEKTNVTPFTFSVIVPKSGKIAKAKPFETN